MDLKTIGALVNSTGKGVWPVITGTAKQLGLAVEPLVLWLLANPAALAKLGADVAAKDVPLLIADLAADYRAAAGT